MSNNLFALLDVSDDEEQPKVVDKKAPAAAKKDAAAKPAAGAKPAAKAPEAKKDAAPAKDNKPKPAGDKAAKPATDKPKTDKAAKPAAASGAAEEDAPTGKDNNRGGTARHRDQRGGRGGRGHGVPESAEGQTRVKREFDRRSGSGRGREVSKGGRGNFGFGNPAQDAQDAEKDPNAVEAILEPTEGAAEEEPEVVAEPEPATFTLDQYLAKRDEARKALLANETKVRAVDTKALAGLAKKEEETNLLYMAEKVKAAKADPTKKDQRSTTKAQVLDVAFKFAEVRVDDDSDRPRGGRGGRGGRGEGRGDGGRGGGRGRGRSSAGPNAGSSNGGKPSTVFNSLDFPSL